MLGRPPAPRSAPSAPAREWRARSSFVYLGFGKSTLRGFEIGISRPSTMSSSSAPLNRVGSAFRSLLSKMVLLSWNAQFLPVPPLLDEDYGMNSGRPGQHLISLPSVRARSPRSGRDGVTEGGIGRLMQPGIAWVCMRPALGH